MATSSVPASDSARPPPVTDPSDRDALAQRILPHMQFSSGSSTSATPAPLPPARETYNARQQAESRFAISGGAIVTGGMGGIGLSLARGLLEHGAPGVVLFDMPATLESPTAVTALATLRADFPSATISTEAVDVTVEAAVAAAVDAAWAALGGVRQLVCCAGIVGVVVSSEQAAEHWRRIVDVNLTGSFLCAKVMARRMREAGTGGSIVLTSSLAGGRTLFPQPQAAYNAAKAGVTSLTRSLAAEWAVDGVRVNSIAPGYMDTVLNEGPGLAKARQTWMERCPMGRMGVPEELVGAVLLLCSKAGSYITGTEIAVDGGSSTL